MSPEESQRHRVFLREFTVGKTVIGLLDCLRADSLFSHFSLTRMVKDVREWRRTLMVFGGIGLAIPSQAAPVDFVREIRPLFKTHCYDCHSGDTRKSGLRLDVKSAAMKGGDHHGPDIVPGEPDRSPLIHFLSGKIEDKLMPPKGGPLSATEIALITRWIAEGAVWPDGVDEVILEDPADHWSFKALKVPEVPGFKFQVSGSVKSPAEGQLETSNLKLETNPIDHFVDAKLAENGLRRSPPADPATLLRRLSLAFVRATTVDDDAPG